MKILVAIDGSDQAKATLQALAQRIGWFRDKPEITVMHVHLPLPHGAASSWVGKKTLQHYYDDESDQLLAGARELLDSEGIAYSTQKKVGDPAHEIVAHAQTNGFDLIVVGARGHTMLVELVIGSVASKVIAATRLPVMLLK